MVDLLLLKYCLLLLPLFEGVLCLVFVLCVRLVLPSSWERESWLLTLTVFLMSRDCQCSVALPLGAVALSAMCLVFPKHSITQLLFRLSKLFNVYFF